jgi:glycerol-3-phosphate acyltransferase PlsY
VTAQTWAILVSSYLLGSVPSSYLVARFAAGVDIRQVGDGNMGTKNTFESVGWLAGLVVVVVDIAKGALAVTMARHCNLQEDLVFLSGACTVLGHDFPLFLHFRNGQGMATMIGIFGVLFPREMGLGLLALALALVITHSWDLSCGIGLGLLPVLLWLAGSPPKWVLYPVLLLPTIGLKKLMQVWQARRVAA